MSFAIKSIAGNVVAISCVIAAAVLAYKGLDGWGWFLFVALLTHTTLSSTPVVDERQEGKEGEVHESDTQPS